MKKTMNRLIGWAMVGVMVFLSTGCSAFRPHNQTMNITCHPDDAILMINGQRYPAPAQVRVPRNRDVSIQAHKEGYSPYQRTIQNHLNATGALDIVGTLLILLPGIGLFFPGAWSLDETDVAITLFKE